VPEVVRKLGVTEQTYYRWKREYGGLRTDQAKRLKDLEKENGRLKRLLADAELDKAILRHSPSGMSASGATPRPVGMQPADMPRKASATHVKSFAPTTRHGLPGRN